MVRTTDQEMTTTEKTVYYSHFPRGGILCPEVLPCRRSIGSYLQDDPPAPGRIVRWLGSRVTPGLVNWLTLRMHAPWFRARDGQQFQGHEKQDHWLGS